MLGVHNRQSAIGNRKSAISQILADEPTGTLDTQTGSEIMEVFLSLNRLGQTIFMVTHNPENAKLADRTVHMLDGRLICAPAEERTM